MSDIGGGTSEILGGVEAYLEDQYVGPIIGRQVGDLIVLRGGDIEIFYVMRGRDTNCVGLQYRYWTVLNQPDFLATYYTGAFCGVGLALTEITIVKIGMG